MSTPVNTKAGMRSLYEYRVPLLKVLRTSTLRIFVCISYYGCIQRMLQSNRQLLLLIFLPHLIEY